MSLAHPLSHRGASWGASWGHSELLNVPGPPLSAQEQANLWDDLAGSAPTAHHALGLPAGDIQVSLAKPVFRQLSSTISAYHLAPGPFTLS